MHAALCPGDDWNYIYASLPLHLDKVLVLLTQKKEHISRCLLSLYISVYRFLQDCN